MYSILKLLIPNKMNIKVKIPYVLALIISGNVDTEQYWNFKKLVKR